jgi:radical SAM protein with 4Fe4S-binding SPASM domain
VLTARVPNRITLLLTHRCPLSCEFCFDASQVLTAAPTGDMSLEVVDRLLELLRASSVRDFNVSLSGGEPTLHPSFLDILARITEAGFSATILSNGQTLADPRFMDEVLRFNVWNFQFSIEGASAAVHDARVGCPGAWERTLRALENALARKARFITNSTLAAQNPDEAFRLIDFLAEVGVPKMNIGNTLPENGGANRSVLVEYPAVVQIAEELTLYALTRSIGFSFITPLPLCLKGGRVLSNPSVCSAGSYSIVMNADGTLRACSVCLAGGPHVASLRTYADAGPLLRPFVEREVRSHVPDDCLRCESLDACRAACPLYWKVPGVLPPSAWPKS